MTLLWGITILWAFSFSLIGAYLSGQVDDYIAVTSRMLLALIIFLPFWRPIAWRKALVMMATGAIEIGLTYLFLYHSYHYLSVPELLLFTIFTPIYVSLFADLFARRWPKQLWAPAILAVAGAAMIRWTDLSENYWKGFALIQAANACFAFGQVWYRHQSQHNPLPHRTRFAWFFMGATLITGSAMLALADWHKLPVTPLQQGVLLWLGVVTSGLGYLGWSYGSTKVNAQQLAVMNNMLIPAGILVNVVFWQGQIHDWPRLALGCVCMLLALWLCRQPTTTTAPQRTK
ncbi:EamA family transporter [Shewanella yunxiaonensis]|uniref:EamA family transporter n=1 Tax=Shewanella yunxiaonensis TaxID=2829809 RepID=A0ABX7YWV3_9GAMM|nr:EamA family transporter [Shewanella yunxiaonensis]QUN07243.1 EamA family transporter [Shewanella yunxiaonensis]